MKGGIKNRKWHCCCLKRHLVFDVENILKCLLCIPLKEGWYLWYMPHSPYFTTGAVFWWKPHLCSIDIGNLQCIGMEPITYKRNRTPADITPLLQPTQQNSYSIYQSPTWNSDNLVTGQWWCSQWLDSDGVVTLDNCQQLCSHHAASTVNNRGFTCSKWLMG